MIDTPLLSFLFVSIIIQEALYQFVSSVFFLYPSFGYLYSKGPFKYQAQD